MLLRYSWQPMGTSESAVSLQRSSYIVAMPLPLTRVSQVAAKRTEGAVLTSCVNASVKRLILINYH